MPHLIFYTATAFLLLNSCSRQVRQESLINWDAPESIIDEGLQGNWVNTNNPAMKLHVHNRLWVESAWENAAATDSFYLRIVAEDPYPFCQGTPEVSRYFVLSSPEENRQYGFVEISGETLHLTTHGKSVWFKKVKEGMAVNDGR